LRRIPSGSGTPASADTAPIRTGLASNARPPGASRGRWPRAPLQVWRTGRRRC
jgi:hypothetical protein